MPPKQAQRIVLASRPIGLPTHKNFRTETHDLPTLQDGEVLVASQYISVDPYMRGRMNDTKSYVPPYQINAVIDGATIAKVMESKTDGLQPGDLVTGQIGWQTHAVLPANQLRKIDPDIAPVTTALSLLGATGLTAYFGLIDICQPQPGETIVVSGGAGAVGTVVGQIGKILGCKVAGIAGSDEKCAYLTQKLGFDAAINYKTTENIGHALKETCPNGVDVYFDNVGGSITDAVLQNINNHARISVCGQISLYNLDRPDVGPRIESAILIYRAMMKGFIITDYAKRFPEGLSQLAVWYREGKLRYEETIVEGFDHTVDAFLGLFHGANLGKQLVRV